MKKRWLAVFTAVLLLFTLALAACGEGKKSSDTAEEFTAAVQGIVLPLTKDSADELNGAYDLYYALGEDAQRAAAEGKEKLDGYAELCNSILAVIYRANEIGEYRLYSAYGSKLAAAQQAYDVLVKLDKTYEADKDVAAAKAIIDEARSIYDAKTAQIDGYVNAVAAVGAYDDTKTLYTEWTAKLAAAEEAYEAVSSAEDDMYSLARVSEARTAMRGYTQKKASLDAAIADFAAKVAAAGEAYDLAFGESAPFYDDIVNAAFDAAENAYIVAQAANLTADTVTESARAAWAGLSAKYDGVRFATNFESDMSGVEAMLGLPSMAEELEEKLTAAEEHYARIPEADRGKVAELKALFDEAKEKLPELKAGKTFIESVSGIDFATAISLEEAETAVQEAHGNWEELVDTFGYESGIKEIDDAKALLSVREGEIQLLAAFIEAADDIPPVEEIAANKESYDKITAASQAYAALNEVQQKYAIVVSANIKRTAAEEKMESFKTDMFSVPAFTKEGETVQAGIAALSLDEETGLISGIGSRANYLQLLYAAAAHAEGHKVNGIVIDEQNSANVDAEAVQTYMEENFEYIFSIYDQNGAKVGEVRKDVVYDEAAQAPALAELQIFFPVYHNEEAQVSYGFGYSVAVKEDASDERLLYSFRDSSTYRSEEIGSITGDISKQDTLSPANIIALQDTDGGGTLQLMRKDSVVCAYGEALNYQYVGAYDLYFYEGEEVSDENLLEWVRTVRETGTNMEGTYVRNFRGRSLEEKGFKDITMTDREYIAAGVEDITSTVKGPSGAHQDHGWVVSGKAGYVNAWTRARFISDLFAALGHSIPEGTTVTVVAQLKVNAAGIEAGIKDSPFSAPIQITF